jgi:galactokinase
VTDDEGLRERFGQALRGRPELIVRSPGRVNLIGEHTDYNDGWVLPAALDMGTDVAARARDDRMLRVVAPRLGAGDLVSLDDLRPTDGPEWTRYVRGSAAMVEAAGHRIPGADLLIDSDLPIGAGLSSSASLELGVAVALLSLVGATWDRDWLARLGQRVENEVVGVRSGIMDQLAVARGVAGHALLIDCRSLSAQPVPVPPQARILILDSAVPRTLAGSAYNDRRAECESALAALRVADPGLRALRDVTPELLAAEKGRLKDVELRRARHVVTENQRVLDATAALRSGEVERFGQLMCSSHASLRDDYEVSGPELDALVEIAVKTGGVYGARLTGAGFGGCAVALVAADRARQAATSITEAYQRTTGRAGTAEICTPSDGTHVRWTESPPSTGK